MNREAKIGLFVLSAFAVIAYFVVRTGEFTALWKGEQPRRHIEIALDDASGLREGTDVRVYGVKVGELEEIRLEDGQAVARLAIDENVPLFANASVELRSLGVLGERFVAISPGTQGPFPASERLRAKVPAGLEDVTGTIQAIGEDLKIITANLRASTQTAAGANRLDLIAGNIEELTRALVEMMKENRGSIKTTTGQIAELSGNLNRGIPALVEQMTALAKELRAMAGDNRGRVDETLKNAASISGKFDAASESLASIAKKIDEGRGTIGKLINDPETNQNLNKVLVKAEESLGEVQKFLNQTNRLQLDLHFDTQYLERYSTTKNAFGVTLRPSENKYYTIEGVARGDEYLSESYEQVSEEYTYDADGNLLTHTVITEREREKDLAITGLIAYRFDDFFVRGGMIEGEGGAGLDYAPSEKPYQIRFEGYDFSRQSNLPVHGRLDLSLKVGKNIQFRVGWDDVFESDRSSLYLGGGIRWKDDDLKVILLQAGSMLKK